MATTKKQTKKTRAKRAASTKPNKGFEKIRKLTKLALEIRNAAGFTTETIKVKKYKIKTMPEAIKKAKARLDRTKKENRSGILHFGK